MRLAAALPDGTGQGLLGIVAERLYVGADTSLVVHLAGGASVRVLQQNSEAGGSDTAPEPGTAVVVSWSAGSARLLNP
jgi:hypothetical protein